jgi:putative membrane-bound dehydrogenase-like protein
MLRLHALALSLACGFALLAQLPAAEPAKSIDDVDFSAELPRIPPLTPAEAAKKILVKPSFRVEQAAAEPLVNSPVAVDWDEDGRMYVCEMRGYSEHRDEGLSRITLVEDTNDDGFYDRSTVFTDKLFWPTAVTCWDGGVYIADAPDIFYCKDTDGDGKADVKQKVFTGFSTSNVQGLLNSFHWTLDNRIHGSSSTTGGEIRLGDQPQGKVLNVRGRDFSFDPRLNDLRTETGGGQHGMSFDNWGRKFVCSNSNHIQQVMAEDRYLGRNPFLTTSSATISIAADGPQAEVFRSSPVEPWRIVRTRLRVSGAVKGMVEGGGRAAGYFTGATGVTIYRGDQFPSDLHGIALIGDVGSNLAHRKKLTLNGVQYTATRIDEQSEFVASTDIWFRPAQFANGPDGCLYILDVCREVIEHPASIPPMIKKHLDLDHGRDRGRIYRVVPEGVTHRKTPKLSKASTAELVALLEHPNAWHRDTASRLLFTRKDSAAIEPLRKLAASSASPLGRMHAMYALDGLKKLDAAVVLKGLGDESPRVREHAVRLAERVIDQSPDISAKLLAMTDDADTQVRYQLAFTLGQLPAATARPAIIALMKRDYADRWMRTALLSSLPLGAADVVTTLLADESLRQSTDGRSLLATLATQSALEADKDGPKRIIATVDKLAASDNTIALVLVRGLSEGLARKGRPLSEVFGGDSGSGAGDIFRNLLSTALNTAGDDKRAIKDRVEAIQTLALANFADVKALFTRLLDNRQAQEVQQAALATLGKYSDPGVGPIVTASWETLSPRLKTVAAETLVARPDRIVALLDAIEKGTVQAAEIEPARISLLTSHRDPAIKDRAAKLFGSLKLARRQEVVDTYRPALKLTGDPVKGKLVFGKICAACHRVENVGHEIGPSLTAIKNRGAEAILLNVLDPSREVNPQFINYVLITDDGRSLTGMIASETATSVTLKRAENQQDTVLRLNIEELRSTGLSIMPEGMEKQIDQQTMADVIAYLMGLN